MVTFMACRDGTGPSVPRFVQLALEPRFQVGGGTNAQPISRIRLTARAVDGEGTPLDQDPVAVREVTVDPNASEWRLDLNVPTTDGPAQVVTEVELINLPAAGEPLVEWAGRSDVITVGRGERVERADIPIGRGPLPNLDLTGVAIEEHPTQLFVGDSTDLVADLSPAALPGTRAYWGQLDPAVATVTATGRVRAVAVGTARISLTAGLRADTTTIQVALRPTAASLTIVRGATQSAEAGTDVAVVPTVVVRDGQGQPVAGVTVTFTVTAGGGSLGTINTTLDVVTDVNGEAAVPYWTLGRTAGTNTLTATVAGLTPVTFTATGTVGPPGSIVVVSGNDQSGTAGVALAQPLVAEVRDRWGNPVAGVTVTFASPSTGAAFAPATATTGANGRAQSTWTPALGGGATQTATATAAGVTAPATFTATVTPPPNIVLALADGADKVSLRRTQNLVVTLPAPAPAGGLQLSITSSSPTILNIVDGPTLIIQAGQSTGTIPVTGLAEGNVTITATATCCVTPGPQPGTLATSVEDRSIGLPTTLNVPYGQTASLPINIVRAAPAGGLTITLTSSDPSRVSLAAGTATIPAGQTTASVTVNGVLPGPSQIVASHPLYTPDTTAATTTAALDLTATTYNLNASFGTTATVRFTSAGTPVAAPAPGITYTVESRNPACVAVAGPTTIATGLVTADLALSYPAGGTTLPCTTRLVVTPSQAGIAADSATVNVAVTPGISVGGAVTVGAGLQRQQSFSLGASNHGGVTVRITSPDPNRLLVSSSVTAAGTATLDVPILNGSASATYYLQAIDTASGTHVVTVTAPSFTTATYNATIATPRFDLVSVNTNTTTLSVDDPVTVRTGTGSTVLNEIQDRRGGAPPLVVTLTTSDPAVVQAITSSTAGTTATAQVVAGQSNTPTSLASGGFGLRPAGNGTTTVTATIPGFIGAPGTATVTVTTPAINVGTTNWVGAGLQRQMSASLGAPAPAGGTTVRLTSQDAASLLVSPNATTAGTPFIDVTVPAGQVSFSYYVQGLEGQTDTTGVGMTATGYGSATQPMIVQLPSIELISYSPTTTTLSGDDAFAVRIGIAINQTSFMSEIQDVRAGGTPYTVQVATDTPSVATIVTSGGVTNPATLTIPVGQSNTPTTVPAGGAAVRPLAGGITRLLATTQLPSRTIPAATATITVSQPGQTLFAATVGAGLQRQSSGSLGASGHGGVTVRLTSADPSRLLLAPNATTAGAAFIDIPVAAGASSYAFYLQGVEGQSGSVAVTATTPGFATGTNNYTVQAPRIELINVNTTTTTLSNNDAMGVRIGIGTTSIIEVQDVRSGGTPIVATVASSAPSVAAITPSSNGGASGTITLNPNTSTLTTLAIDPLTAGQTTISVSATQGALPIAPFTNGGSFTVTVSAPAISVTSNSTVGAGLMRSASLSLGAPAPTGGFTVTLTSSQPGVVLVSNSATTAGAASTTITFNAGATSSSFWVHGVDGQTGTATITATASGFTDGTGTGTVATPYIDVQSITASPLASAADDPFIVRVGLPTSNGLSLNEPQSRRAGQPPLQVTVTSTNAAAGVLATSTTRAATATTTIAAGENDSPGTVATGGVAFDPVAPGTTTVRAEIPGFTRTVTTNDLTITVQAGLIQAVTRAAVTRQ